MNKYVKSVVCAAMALVICLFCTACGETPPAGSASPAPVSDGPDANPLVFAVVNTSAWIANAVEEYNAAGPERPVELLRFYSYDDLLDKLEAGLEADMYFTEVAAGANSERNRALWDASADLSGRLTTPLAGNLAEAMSSDGELRFLPFDFELSAMVWTLGEERPASMAEAQSLCDAAGRQLYYGTWSPYSLAYGWFYPYLCAAGDEARADMLASFLTQDYRPDDSYLSGYSFCTLRSEASFGLEGLVNNCPDGWADGVSGSETLGMYEVRHVFGILNGCGDEDAAWDFLSVFLGDELQSLAYALPASAAALEARIAELADIPSTSPETELHARELIENTTVANSPALDSANLSWLSEWTNSPEYQAASERFPDEG